MSEMAGRALYQAFLSPHARDLAHVWKFSLEFGGRRPLHFHAEPELNLVVSGWATFRVGDSTVDACKCDLLAFPAGQEHALLRASSDVYLFAIGMDAGFSAEILRDHRQHAAAPMHLTLTSRDFASVVNRASAAVDRDGTDQLAAELWEQASWLRQRNMTYHDKPMHVVVHRALSVIAENPHWDCERVARASRTQASELSRYFHRDLRMTFVKYRSRVRLMRLIRLMDERESSLTSAATAVGFGSYSQCHRVFQSELGCSPREFFAAGIRERMQQRYEPDHVSTQPDYPRLTGQARHRFTSSQSL